MAKSEFPLARVYGLIEPGPVVLLSTKHRGKHNVMPMSWTMMMEFEPPLIACIVSARNDSFAALDASGECVINIPTMEIAEAVVGCGNCTGKDIDKFERFDLTPQPASQVDAPLIGECFASLECKVADRGWVDRYNLFVLEVVKAWLDADLPDGPTLHHRGFGRFMLAGETVELQSKMR